MLLLFGSIPFAAIRYKSIRPASSNKGSYFHNFITAFFVTLFQSSDHIPVSSDYLPVLPLCSPVSWCSKKLRVSCHCFGGLVWWLGITYFVNKVRTKFNLRGIWILNRVIGSIVMLVSVAGLSIRCWESHFIKKKTYESDSQTA